MCVVCQLPKAQAVCGLCGGNVCKKCAEKFRPENLVFLSPLPDALSFKLYCGRCYDSKVAPQVQHYEALVDRARQVHVYYRHQSEETRLMSRIEKPLRTPPGKDRAQTLLHLAYLAVVQDFDTLIDVELRSEKVRDEGYQTTRWTGTGIPSSDR